LIHTDIGARRADPGGDGNRKATRIERSAGGVVVRALAGDWYALLIKDPYGKWSLPKGHMEGGESLREAAAREVEEETGIRPEVVGPRIDTVDWIFRDGDETIHKYCTFYLMRSRTGEAVPQSEEGIAACMWLPVADAASRVAYADTREVILRVDEKIAEAGR